LYLRAIGVIPARFSSSRFPGKALASIHGTPLIVWVARGASESKLLDRVLVATDDERIAAAAAKAGFEAVMTPAELRSGSDRVWQAARGTDAELIVNIQGDEASITGGVVDSCVRPLIESDAADVVTLRTPIADGTELRNPNAVKVVTDRRGFALYFSRSPIPHSGDNQVRKNLHFLHVGVYAYRRDALRRFCELPQSPLEQSEHLEQLRGLEAGLRYLVIDTDYRSVEVNTPADLARAAAALQPLEDC
jgi:3-deoxy-manno-octulosonate cytidylyltransferase (CMP-KDO synthetase)